MVYHRSTTGHKEYCMAVVGHMVCHIDVTGNVYKMAMVSYLEFLMVTYGVLVGFISYCIMGDGDDDEIYSSGEIYGQYNVV